MEKIIKKTISIALENEKYIQVLMSKIKFVENSRVATGGMMSSPILLIEFQGDENDYHEKGYIVEKSKKEWLEDMYYTLKNPNGFPFKTLNNFIEEQNKDADFNYSELL